MLSLLKYVPSSLVGVNPSSSKTRDGIIKDEESSLQLKSSSINKDFKNLRSNSIQQGENDKALIPTKDDDPWQMIRRKGVP